MALEPHFDLKHEFSDDLEYRLSWLLDDVGKHLPAVQEDILRALRDDPKIAAAFRKVALEQVPADILEWIVEHADIDAKRGEPWTR